MVIPIHRQIQETQLPIEIENSTWYNYIKYTIMKGGKKMSLFREKQNSPRKHFLGKAFPLLLGVLGGILMARYIDALTLSGTVSSFGLFVALLFWDERSLLLSHIHTRSGTFAFWLADGV